MNTLTGSADFAAAAARRARVLLALLLGVSVLVAFLTGGTYDSGDSIKHYLIAHYAFEYPLNFLDSWAKPLFTLLASGPAQAGFIGMKLFQCGIVAASAWCAYGIARALRLPAPELAVLFTYAAPDYFLIQFSGLTEPLFGLVLVGAAALACANQPGWSAALISWLPFVRTEGVALVGLWGVYLLWQRQWRVLPLLALGFAVYSAVGAVVLGEPGWVLSHNPYATVSVYGHGKWTHFAGGLPKLLGWVLTGLAMVGGLCKLRDCLRPARRQQPFFSAEVLLVYGSATLFIVLHTVLWAKGLFNSLGLLRVLTVTVPLFAVIALNGLAELALFGRTAAARQGIRLAGAGAAVAFFFSGQPKALQWTRDFTLPNDQRIVADAAAWIRQTPGLAARPLAYEFPYVAVATHNNLFDPRLHPRLVPEALPVGTLVVWDDWYAPVEGKVPLAALRTNPHFRQRWEKALLRHPELPLPDTTRVVVFERVR